VSWTLLTVSLDYVLKMTLRCSTTLQVHAIAYEMHSFANEWC
jgi:hypothetical protein